MRFLALWWYHSIHVPKHNNFVIRACVINLLYCFIQASVECNFWCLWGCFFGEFKFNIDNRIPITVTFAETILDVHGSVIQIHIGCKHYSHTVLFFPFISTPDEFPTFDWLVMKYYMSVWTRLTYCIANISRHCEFYYCCQFDVILESSDINSSNPNVNTTDYWVFTTRWISGRGQTVTGSKIFFYLGLTGHWGTRVLLTFATDDAVFLRFLSHAARQVCSISPGDAVVFFLRQHLIISYSIQIYCYQP